MGRTRAFRILNREKLKQRARKIARIWNKSGSTVEEDHLIKDAEHLKMCSCTACGNPRKHFKEKTIQEKINDIDFKEEIEEING